MNIGDTIKKERKEKNMSQSDLAEKLKTTQDTISLWELNKRTPSIEHIILLCNIFSMSIEEFIDVKKDKDGKYIF